MKMFLSLVLVLSTVSAFAWGGPGMTKAMIEDMVTRRAHSGFNEVMEKHKVVISMSFSAANSSDIKPATLMKSCLNVFKNSKSAVFMKVSVTDDQNKTASYFFIATPSESSTFERAKTGNTTLCK